MITNQKVFKNDYTTRTTGQDKQGGGSEVYKDGGRLLQQARDLYQSIFFRINGRGGGGRVAEADSESKAAPGRTAEKGNVGSSPQPPNKNNPFRLV